MPTNKIFKFFVISSLIFLSSSFLAQGLTLQEILQGHGNPKGQVLGASTTCGNTGAQVGTDNSDANLFLGIPDCVPGANSTVQSCAVGVNSAAGNISCAVYADLGGAPTGSALCQSVDTVAVTGLNTLALSGCGILNAGSTYWIVVSTNNNALKYVRTGDSSATDKYQSGSYPTFPTAGSWQNLGVYRYQFYLNLDTVGGGGDTTAPSVPTGLSAAAVSQSAINLSWAASSDNVGVTGYTIYRRGVQVGTTVNNNYNDNGLSSATQYTYTVDAYDAAGNHSAQSSSSSATTQSPPPPDTTPPTTPTGLSATAISSSGINLSWTVSTDNVVVTGYKIYRGGSQIGTSVTNSYSDSGLAASTAYTYTVSAYDAAGNSSAQSTSASATTQAQQQSGPLIGGIIDSSRAVNWNQTSPGVVGGIPSRSTICATLNPGATSAQINAAIAACPAGGVVFLNAGTYAIASGINFASHSSVTLRGAGPTQTILKFTGPDGCSGLSSDICMINSLPQYDGSANVLPGGSNAATWSGGYAQGATQITLANIGSSAPHVGDLLMLDQADDTTDNGGVMQCVAIGTCSANGGSAGRVIGGVRYNQIQVVKITAINGNAFSISPGLYANNWRASQNPGAWWSNNPLTNAGVENMTLDHTASTQTSGVNFYNCYNCWLKNIRSMNSGRNQVYMVQSAHVEVRDSYFYAAAGGAEGVYGIETSETSDDLIENNIFQQVGAPLVFNGGTSGMVIGYNFSWDNIFTPSATWMQVSYPSHEAGSHMNLYEGNYFDGLSSDDQHGGSPLMTIFRNWLPGNMPPPNNKTQATWSLELEPTTRAWNVVGNVLGTPGYHTGYETAPALGAPSGSCNNYILTLGWSNVGCQSSGTPGNDILVRSTLFRWGNFDTVNNSVRWNPAEVPTAGVTFVNGQSVPSGQTLPSSLYLSAKPAWWPAATPWPPIGPDVNGGQGPGGHAYITPAYSCFNNTAVDVSYGSPILAFDASTCYASSGGSDATPPTTPTGLSATAISSSAINLSWTASTDNVGVTGYKIYRGGLQIATVTSGTSYADTGLAANTAYSYTVSAYDAAGNSSVQSSSASATTYSGIPVPGDLNLDHIVNSLDYSIMNTHWLQNYPVADINSDGLVNSIDFAIMKSNWGKVW